MRDYVIRRLLLFIPVIIGVSLAIFIVMRIVPGDVAVMILVGPGGQGDANPTQVVELRHKLGLDKPLLVQYGLWVKDMATLNFGTSLQKNTSILDEIGRRLPRTLEIAFLTTFISVLIAVPLGMLCAIKQNSWLDYCLRMLSIGGLAMPVFWTATLIILILSLNFNWTMPVGYSELWKDPLRNFKQVVWACLALGYYYAAIVARMTRSSMLEVLRQDYVRTAWAKGLRERAVMVQHALKNAFIPVITIVGLQFAFLLGGTVIMETIFTIPGIGLMLIEAIKFRDYPVVQTLTVLFALFILVSNMLVDLAYGWLDPRIRYG